MVSLKNKGKIFEVQFALTFVRSVQKFVRSVHPFEKTVCTFAA